MDLKKLSLFSLSLVLVLEGGATFFALACSIGAFDTCLLDVKVLSLVVEEEAVKKRRRACLTDAPPPEIELGNAARPRVAAFEKPFANAGHKQSPTNANSVVSNDRNIMLKLLRLFLWSKKAHNSENRTT